MFWVQEKRSWQGVFRKALPAVGGVLGVSRDVWRCDLTESAVFFGETALVLSPHEVILYSGKVFVDCREFTWFQ